jgi:hypothetical protein
MSKEPRTIWRGAACSSFTGLWSMVGRAPFRPVGRRRCNNAPPIDLQCQTPAPGSLRLLHVACQTEACIRKISVLPRGLEAGLVRWSYCGRSRSGENLPAAPLGEYLQVRWISPMSIQSALQNVLAHRQNGLFGQLREPLTLRVGYRLQGASRKRDGPI